MEEQDKVKRAIDLLTSIGNRENSEDERGERSSRFGQSCSRAVDALRNIRGRLGRTSGSSAAESEQRSNFAPYELTKRGKKRKPTSWTVKSFCLASRFANKVPTNIGDRERLVSAGLGEKKVTIPDVECSWDTFKEILATAFPKLIGCGGFDLLRCVPNTKDIEVISVAITHSPKLLKSVVGNGRVFIRPIQRDLSLVEKLAPCTEIKEECIYCKEEVPVEQLRSHVRKCSLKSISTDFSSDESSDDFMQCPPPKVSHLEKELEKELYDEQACDPSNMTTVFFQESDCVVIPDDIEIEDTSGKMCTDNTITCGTMTEVVKMLAAKYVQTADEFVIPVRRDHVFGDALRSVKRSVFSPSSVIHVEFLGEVGQDGGGPKREFWNLLSKEISMQMFEGTNESHLVPIHDAVGLQSRNFYYVGMLIAISLLQDGSGFPYFAPPIYDYLCGAEPQEIVITVDDVPRHDARKLIIEIQTASDISILHDVCYNGIDLLCEAGYNIPVNCVTLDGRPVLLKTLLLYFTLHRCKAEIDQLRDGLSVCGVMDSLCKYSTVLKPYFVCVGAERKLSADYIKNLFKIIFSEKGTTDRCREETVYMYFLDLLHDCEDNEESEVKLEHILQFFTGCDYPPPLGFQFTPLMRFYNGQFPTASTCALELTLPTKHHDNPKLFRDNVIYGLKNHGGFGLL